MGLHSVRSTRVGTYLWGYLTYMPRAKREYSRGTSHRFLSPTYEGPEGKSDVEERRRADLGVAPYTEGAGSLASGVSQMLVPEGSLSATPQDRGLGGVAPVVIDIDGCVQNPGEIAN